MTDLILNRYAASYSLIWLPFGMRLKELIHTPFFLLPLLNPKHRTCLCTLQIPWVINSACRTSTSTPFHKTLGHMHSISFEFHSTSHWSMPLACFLDSKLLQRQLPMHRILPQILLKCGNASTNTSVIFHFNNSKLHYYLCPLKDLPFNAINHRSCNSTKVPHKLLVKTG